MPVGRVWIAVAARLRVARLRVSCLWILLRRICRLLAVLRKRRLLLFISAVTLFLPVAGVGRRPLLSVAVAAAAVAVLRLTVRSRVVGLRCRMAAARIHRERGSARPGLVVQVELSRASQETGEETTDRTGAGRSVGRHFAEVALQRLETLGDVVGRVVFAVAYAVGSQNDIEIRAAVWTGARPFFHDGKHFHVELAVAVAESGMMEGSADVAEDFVGVHFGVLPAVDDARNDILQDFRGHLAGRVVEYVGKVVWSFVSGCT